MKKIIIIDEKNKKRDENILDELFSLRYSKLEGTLKERKKFIEKNNLRDVTQDDIIEKIESIPNIETELKEDILKSIDKLLDNRLRIQTFDSELYYKAGVSDIVNVIFNDNNEIIDKKTKK